MFRFARRLHAQIWSFSVPMYPEMSGFTFCYGQKDLLTYREERLVYAIRLAPRTVNINII